LSYLNVLSRAIGSAARVSGLLQGQMWGRSTPMLDVIVLALGAVFFVLSIGYAYACDRL